MREAGKEGSSGLLSDVFQQSMAGRRGKPELTAKRRMQNAEASAQGNKEGNRKGPEPERGQTTDARRTTWPGEGGAGVADSQDAGPGKGCWRRRAGAAGKGADLAGAGGG